MPGLAAASALGGDTVTISILHTTDLHGHILPTLNYDGTPDVGGLARCVTQIRKWRKQNPNSILIDVGDVYQGTDVGLRTRGSLMIDLFNHLRFDAWIVGNHEFDWGIDPFVAAVDRSRMPVLAANMSMEGREAGQFHDSRHPFSKVRPYIIKEFAGIRVAIIGITTPGMRFWFRPEFIRDLNFLYPVDPVRRAIEQAKHDGANAVVLAGHMGLKDRGGGDDFANTLVGLTSEFPELPVFIAGHTHQLIPRRFLNNSIVTQADHFGIHIGKVDLRFDRDSKRLIGCDASCELMDKRVGLNHTVLSRARSHLAISEKVMGEPIGELAETFRVRSNTNQPSDVEMLIGMAISESLRERGTKVEGVFHGLFDTTHNVAPGRKTVADVWNILPYENYVVTGELTPDELCLVMEEMYAAFDPRSLIGFDVRTTGAGKQRKVISLVPNNSQIRERREKYVIAFNTFDSRSAGHRFMKLREILERPEARCVFHDVQTRDALIDYFRRHKVVKKRWDHSVPAAA
ncbi:MAG TPA: bifunctional UDP-sugar hydrolase/5'-nucleotidase [Chthoniobacterales bacterium]|nr:bifunctional UDP-sugar hydrolase/5'-nucleotidase [Chthoniobacterales bacterium]